MTEDIPYTADYVRVRVEEAGKTLLMIPNTGVWPMRYASTWPEVLREWEDMLGCNLELDPPRIRPTMKQMNEYAEVMDWVVMLATYCREKHFVHVAKAIGYGMLHRQDGRRLLSWRKLGTLLGTDHKRAQAWYDDGIEIIARILNKRVGTNNAESIFRTGNKG
jgi:hypothetical protein